MAEAISGALARGGGHREPSPQETQVMGQSTSGVDMLLVTTHQAGISPAQPLSCCQLALEGGGQ